MYYTFEFLFYNTLDECRDCTAFCAKDKDEAFELFKAFCKENGFETADTEYTYEIIYDQDDAKWYGEEW